MNELVGPPAPRPCVSCPYRTDAPSGLWDAAEYAKLRNYDADTGEQPDNLFLCHQNDHDSEQRRLCAGWVGCHGESLLALRLGAAIGHITNDTYCAAVEYTSPVPLFISGKLAAEHGMRDYDRPGPAAVKAAMKISRRRKDLA